MIEFSSFHSDHVSELHLRHLYDDDKKAINRIIANSYEDDDPVFTIYNDKKPIAVVGMEEVWEGLGSVWAIISDDVKECGVGFSRVVLGLLDFLIEKFSLRRVQMTVRCGFKDNERFAEFLGFKRESVLESFGPTGDDYYMYARFV